MIVDGKPVLPMPEDLSFGTLWKMHNYRQMTDCPCCDGVGHHMMVAEIEDFHVLQIQPCYTCATTGQVEWMCAN